MDIEFDLAKDAANRAKHGISLRAGAVVLSHLVGDEIDDDGAYGEERIRAYGFVGTRLFVAVYSMRREVFRIISVRKATKSEERRWL